VPESAIRQIQQRYADLVLDREEQAVRVANQLIDNMTTTGSGKHIAAPARNSGSSRRQPTTSTAVDRRSEGGQGSSARESTGPSGTASTLFTPAGPSSGAVQQAEQQVAGQGLLGILTTNSNQARQDMTVQDVLGRGGKVGQTSDQVFQNIDRLASSGASTRAQLKPSIGSTSVDQLTTARGARTTSSGARIDQVVSDLPGGGPGSGGGMGQVVTRQESIEKTGLSPLTVEDDTKSGGSLTGARDVAQVSAIVYSHSQAIQYCYERELKRSPELKGKVVVRFTILPTGTVANATIVSSTLNNEDVERCLLSRISRWDDFGAIDERLGNATFRQVYTFGF
jgi:TonB family protein